VPRNLQVVQHPDGAVDFVDVQPGPYSHSAPEDRVLFSITAEEARQWKPKSVDPPVAPVEPTKEPTS